MRFARRFTSVGLVVTAVDVGVLLVGARWSTWPLAVVNAVAVGIATFASYWLHRAVSYPAEPARRWYRDLGQYVLTAAGALAVDVGVFALLTADVDPGSDHTVAASLAPKAVSLFAVVAVRLWFYR